MIADRQERADSATPLVLGKGIYVGIEGRESDASWLGRLLNYLKVLDYQTLVFVLTSLGVTLMGVTPVLANREISIAAAVITCTGILVLGIVGFTAIHKARGASCGTNRKEYPDQSPDTGSSNGSA